MDLVMEYLQSSPITPEFTPIGRKNIKKIDKIDKFIWKRLEEFYE